ncbi:MAG: YibE/F family protein [Clostridia bacterium]|nr:YibE/F family protein [Clostridia bacterium]
MKKSCLFLMFLLVCFDTVFATETVDQTNIIIDENPEIVYVEDYDYSLGFDDGESSIDVNNSDNVGISLKGVVVEAGEPYEYFDEYSIVPVMIQELKVKINDKENDRYNGTVFSVKYQLTDDYNQNIDVANKLSKGDNVYVYANFEDGKLVGDMAIQYFDKTNLIIFIIVIYSLAIILIGGFNGVKALVGLIVTVVAIFTFMIPAIYDGADAMMVTILTSIAVTCFTFLVVSGLKKKTFAAIIGTISGILVASLFSYIFGNLMKLTGISDETMMLTTLENASNFNFKNIMFSGIVIGALGACMDVGMSIASALSEMREEIPDISVKRLIKAGMNIGKDVMGTMTNTLILAYVGSAMTIILLFMGFDFKMYDIINQEMIAEEVLRAIAGSFGLVSTIPLTAIVSAFMMGNKD